MTRIFIRPIVQWSNGILSPPSSLLPPLSSFLSPLSSFAEKGDPSRVDVTLLFSYPGVLARRSHPRLLRGDGFTVKCSMVNGQCSMLTAVEPAHARKSKRAPTSLAQSQPSMVNGQWTGRLRGHLVIWSFGQNRFQCVKIRHYIINIYI